MSDSLQPHGLQHARLPCPSPTPGACSNSCPLSHWCHPTISSSIAPFCFCLQSFPASGSFPMSQLFASGGQSNGVSSSTSGVPYKEHPGLISFRMDWLDLLAVQGTLKSLLQHHSSTSILWHSAFFTVQFSHPYMTNGKTIALTRRTFVGKVTSLLFNMLSRRRQWHPTPVLLPGKSHGRRSLVGSSSWGCKELDTAEWLFFWSGYWLWKLINVFYYCDYTYYSLNTIVS